jgi:hypothetical protein
LYVRDEVICGTEYQEGGSGLSCACRTFAIGRCAECAEPVCGVHSELTGGVRRCLDQARIEGQRRKNDQRESAWLEWENSVLTDLSNTAPVERVIRYLRILAMDELSDRIMRPTPRTPGLGHALRDLLPDLWSADLVSAPPWDHEEVHAWLVAGVPPRATNLLYLNKHNIFERAVLGKLPSHWKRAPAQAWVVNDAPPRPANTSIVAFPDGRRGTIDEYGQCWLSDLRPGFNAYAMWNLGELAQIAPLPDPPERGSRYAGWRLWGT